MTPVLFGSDTEVFPNSCFQCLLLRVNFAKLKLVLQDIEFQTLHCEFPNNFHFGRLELRSAWSPFCELNEVSRKKSLQIQV